MATWSNTATAAQRFIPRNKNWGDLSQFRFIPITDIVIELNN